MMNRAMICFVVSCLFLVSGCHLTKVTLRVGQTPQGKVQLRVGSRGIDSYVHAVSLWDNPECEFIWVLVPSPGRPLPPKSFTIEYGGPPPEGMRQLFPKDNTAPRELKPGEVVVVYVHVTFAGWIAPMSASDMFAFRVSDDGRWIRLRGYNILKPPERVGPPLDD